MVLINGQLVTQIDCTDRGLHYGDGLFETLEIVQGSPVFLQQHLARLQRGCQVLKIPYPEQLLLAEITQLSQGTATGVLKIMLTRGSGGRGYRQPDTIETTRFLALHPFPNYPTSYQTDGIAARFCDVRLGLNPLLAGLKHNNRLENVLARAEWQDDYQEGLLININEQVIEGTMSNLFIVKENTLYTPELSLSGVQGIIRDIIIQLAHDNNMTFQETVLSREQVLAADELFVSNSIIGIWPIASLEQQHYSVGKLTKKLMHLLSAYKQSEQSC